MAVLSANCPRCGVQSVSLQVTANIFFSIGNEHVGKTFSEVFCRCPICKQSSIEVLDRKRPALTGTPQIDQYNSRIAEDIWTSENKFSGSSHSLNDYCTLRGFVSLKDESNLPLPEHLPDKIASVFGEGNACLSIRSFNAAGAMFRMALDLATKPLLPDDGEPSQKVRRSLGLRLQWLFDQGLVPNDLKRLAECIQQDGNDGAHDGTLSKAEAEDLYEFTYELLRRLISEPARLRIAEERRNKRRGDA